MCQFFLYNNDVINILMKPKLTVTSIATAIEWRQYRVYVVNGVHEQEMSV